LHTAGVSYDKQAATNRTKNKEKVRKKEGKCLPALLVSHNQRAEQCLANKKKANLNLN
jgi:hypothetical protein